MNNHRLYFCTRDDLDPGRRAAMLIHAMDTWSSRFGPHGGVVIVFSVPNERVLMQHLPKGGRTIVWREPDLNNSATAFATDVEVKLPLLK